MNLSTQNKINTCNKTYRLAITAKNNTLSIITVAAKTFQNWIKYVDTSYRLVKSQIHSVMEINKPQLCSIVSSVPEKRKHKRAVKIVYLIIFLPSVTFLCVLWCWQSIWLASHCLKLPLVKITKHHWKVRKICSL